MLRRSGWVAVTAGVLASLGMSTPAAGRTPHTRIELGKGIGGINLGMRRGAIQVFTGAPQASPRVQPAPGVYIASYVDEGLGVYYWYRNRLGRPDRIRDVYDQAAGVVTFNARYSGVGATGTPFSGSNCLPIDRQEAPGGGPPRIGYCYIEAPGPSASIVHMSAGSLTRAGQRALGVGVYRGGVAVVYWNQLIKQTRERMTNG